MVFLSAVLMTTLLAIPPDYSYRPLTEEDTKQAHQLSKNIGWSASLLEWNTDVAFAKNTSYAVMHNDTFIGIGLGLRFENHARIARIVIDPNHQKKGVGKALMGSIISALQNEGSTCLELDATEEGKPLYEKLGFTSQARVVTLVKQAGEFTGDQIQDPCYLCEEADLAQIEALDKRACGSSRLFHIQRAFENHKIFVSKQQDKVSGFILCIEGERGIRIGAWTSENETDAARLINTVVHEFSKFKKTIHIPKMHEKALDLIKGLGFEVHYESDTMRLGNFLVNPDHAIRYSLWSLALG